MGTLLIIVVLLFLFGGGGYYWRSIRRGEPPNAPYGWGKHIARISWI